MEVSFTHSPPLLDCWGQQTKHRGIQKSISWLFFFFFAFSGLWPCHTGNIRKDVILTTKYVSLMCLGRRKLQRRKGETRDWDPPSLQTLGKPQRNLKKWKLSQTPSMRVSTCETQRRQRQDQSQLSLTNICGQRDFISSRRATSLSHFRVLQSADHTRSRRKAGGSFFFFFFPTHPGFTACFHTATG